MEFIYLYSPIGTRVTALHLCTPVPVLCLSTRTPVCVCEAPPARGAGLGRGRFPIPRSPFPVPGSRFPIPRSRFPSRRLALGDDEPMARKEPLLSALKGERGAPGTSGSSFLWPARHRSDRTDGGAALGLRGTLPEFLPGSAAAAGESRTGPGCGTLPRGPAELSRGILSPAGHPGVPLSLSPPHRSGAAAAGGRRPLHRHLSAPRVAVPAPGERPAQRPPT